MEEELVLTGEERIQTELRALYESRGYARYKMGKFEDYDLYYRNKDFLISDNIITFTDTNGKLKALKPDVTLSIVRSAGDVPRGVQKLYYNENVYRVSGNTHVYREIMQIGLECMGEVDEFCIAETLVLAAESLKRISPQWTLTVSHLGVVSDLLDRLGLTGEARAAAMRFVGSKNCHELLELCAGEQCDMALAETLAEVICLHGTGGDVFPMLRKLGCDAGAAEQLERLSAVLAAAGIYENVCFDFSMVSDMRYYNGIVFKGYIYGIPAGVLSGGQYDRLMKRMKRSSKAIGFAVYLDMLDRLEESPPAYDVDYLLLYEPGADPAEVYRVSEGLRGHGSVMTAPAVPENLRYRKLVHFAEERADRDGDA